MKSFVGRLILFALVAVTASASEPAKAQSSTSPEIIQDHPTKTLNPAGLYRVEFVCRARGTLPVSDFNVFVNTATAASFLIAVSDQNTGSTPTPDTSKALLSVYNIGGPSTSRTSYVNQVCNGHPFFVAPRKPLMLIAAESKIDTHTLGPALKAIEGGISILSSSQPLFTGQVVPGTEARRLSAVTNSAAPISGFVAAFDKGLTGLQPKALTEGHTLVRANYATVDVYVTALRSIVGVKDNGQFRTDLEGMISTMFKPGISGTSINEAIDTACLAAGNSLNRLNNLSREDIAFSLILVGQTAGLTAASQYIHCLGEYASVAVKKDFISKLDAKYRFDDGVIKTVLPNKAVYPQPDFKTVRDDLVDLMGSMRGYVTLASPPDFNQTTLGRTGMATDVALSDEADISSTPSSATDGKVHSADLMKDLKNKGFTRFGCLMPDTGAVTFFLGLPEKPAQADKGYQPKEAILMRGWVNSDTKLSRLRITVEGDQIDAVVKYNKNICGRGAIFAGG
jgi:hypothetical protein